MIDFQAGNVEMPMLDVALITRWLEMVADAHGFRLGNVNYRFCDDDEILDSNRTFVGHDYYTDIITFDYTRGEVVAGDVLISLDTVRSNAELFKVSYDDELHRVMAHGVLHLCGINDKEPGEREVMEAAENEALAIYASLAEDKHGRSCDEV